MAKPKIKKFKVIVNPFTQSITLSRTLKDCVRQLTFRYTETDEWIGIEYLDMRLDLHILYDQELSVSIYDVVDDAKGMPHTNTDYWHIVSLYLAVADDVVLPYKKLTKKSMAV